MDSTPELFLLLSSNFPNIIKRLSCLGLPSYSPEMIQSACFTLPTPPSGTSPNPPPPTQYNDLKEVLLPLTYLECYIWSPDLQYCIDDPKYVCLIQETNHRARSLEVYPILILSQTNLISSFT